MRFLLVLAVLAVVHFSLYPWQFHAAGFAQPLLWSGINNGSDLTDVIVNLAFYMIPALVGQWAFTSPGRRWRTFSLVVGGLTLLSLSVEFLQLAIPTRFANLRDVVCNMIGALIGAALAVCFPQPERLRLQWTLTRQSLVPLALLSSWANWLAFPFLPHLRLHRLLQIPGQLWPPAWNLIETADIFFALSTIYLATKHLSLRPFTVTGCAALLIPGQAFLRDVSLSPSALLGAALALLAAPVLFQHPRRLHLVALAFLLTLYLVIRQLRPFDLAGAPLHAFEWLPFAPLIEGSARPASLRILSGKLLLYLSTLWIYCHAGLRLSLGALLLVSLLAITESLQRFLPQRTPETTDLALALLAFGVFAIDARLATKPPSPTPVSAP